MRDVPVENKDFNLKQIRMWLKFLLCFLDIGIAFEGVRDAMTLGMWRAGGAWGGEGRGKAGQWMILEGHARGPAHPSQTNADAKSLKTIASFGESIENH